VARNAIFAPVKTDVVPAPSVHNVRNFAILYHFLASLATGGVFLVDPLSRAKHNSIFAKDISVPSGDYFPSLANAFTHLWSDSAGVK
jgi:hypothetical protein